MKKQKSVIQQIREASEDQLRAEGKLPAKKVKKSSIPVEKIEAAILRQQVSHRGGGVEISLDSFGFPGEKMTAYQNYLGGGMLGRILTNDTIRRESLQAKTKKDAGRLDKIALALAKYFHNLTNHEGDPWEEATFEQNQKRPASAY